MNEEWRDIQGYEGLYQVSNLGRVRSCDRFIWAEHNKSYSLWKSKIMNPILKGTGYMHIGLYKEGKRTYFGVHRLVAKALIPNPNNLPQVNHKDESRSNNIATNLEWCTAKYNANYGGHNERISKSMTNRKAQSKPTVQYSLDGKVIARYPSASEASRQTGIHQATISSCCLGISKKTNGYIFRYEV